MATDKEYQAVISALSSECERLHKAINNIRAEIETLPRELPTDARNMVRKARVLDIIDKHR